METEDCLELIEILAKGKAFPIGTRRTWGGQDYIKHHDGWVAVSGPHHGKLMGKFKEEPTHKEHADQHSKPSEAAPKEEDKKEPEPKKDEPKAEADPKEEKPKAEKKPRTPRSTAKKDKEKLDSDGEYANARESKIANVGEDIADSARHKAMLWKDLATAEKDGTADKLVKRDTLLKNEPSELASKMTDTNSLMVTAMHLSLKSFPPAPKASWLKGKEDVPGDTVIKYMVRETAGGPLKSRAAWQMKDIDPATFAEMKAMTADEIRKQARQEYYEAFKNIKAKTEEIAGKDRTPAEAIKELREHVSNMIKEYRKVDSYSDIANALVPMVNNALSPYRTSGVTKDIDKIAKKVSEDNAANLNDIATSIMEGKSVDAALGQSKSKDRFSAASMYVDHASRKGPEAPQKDLQSQTDFLIEKGGLRAIQWGNSVTDSEREHHLKCLNEAMQDLVDVLDLPPEMISFNGRLAIAIGARGKGSALAHYEPDLKVINLTRKSGVGSLAHEWGHFFDNIVAKIGGRGDDGSFASQGVNGMTGHAISDLMDSDAMKEYIKSAKDTLNSMPRDKRERYGDPSYWFSKEEIFARTFERYIQYKLIKSGRENTYLAGLQTERSDGFFWASDEQMEKIAPHLDNVFKVFKDSDDLKKALTLAELAADLKKAAKEPKPDYYAAVIVIDSMGRVLLGKRHEDGLWTSPAGGGHHTETPRECAVRELFEESGIVAKPDDLTPIHCVETANNKHCHVFMHVVPVGLVTSSRLDPDQEIKKWGWYAIEDIPKDLINDERRHSSVRAAYMKYYGITKGGPGSGVVGHKTFHESERNHHYDEGLKIQDILNKIETKIKDRKKIDPDFKVPPAAKEIINELKNRRDEHSKQFKIHNDHHSLALQKEADSEARAKMKKSDLAVDAQGSSIETGNYSLDAAQAGDKWIETFTACLAGLDYGSTPRTIQLDAGYYVSLVKTDDGIYSGIVRQTMDPGQGDALEANVFKIEKQTIPTIIQALKAKEYIMPSVLIPEPAVAPSLVEAIAPLESSEMGQLRRKLEAVKLILDI